MRSAPPVSVHCAGGVVWRGLHAGLPGLAAAAFTAWVLDRSTDLLAATPAWAAAAGCAVAGLAWLAMAPRPVLLCWDGQRWTADGIEGTLEVMIDIGGWLLLRVSARPGGRRRWIAVGAREAGPELHALRAAVYARPGEAAGGAGLTSMSR